MISFQLIESNTRLSRNQRKKRNEIDLGKNIYGAVKHIERHESETKNQIRIGT